MSTREETREDTVRQLAALIKHGAMEDLETSSRRAAERIVDATESAVGGAVQRIVGYLRGIPAHVREDWGLNATEEIALILEAGIKSKAWVRK
jgi:hypothetical protein